MMTTSPSWGARVLDAVLARAGGLPPATCRYTVQRDVRIPMRDGVALLADRYVPRTPTGATVLIRTPYGADALGAALQATPFAARGWPVLVVRCRGTFGSGGSFEPFVHEVDDGAAVVAWLRRQPWFDGRLVTYGGSYLGFNQWALLMDPPPELQAAVIQAGPHDFSRALYAGGAFNLEAWLGWSDQVGHQEDVRGLRMVLRQMAAARRQAPAQRRLPVADAVQELGRGLAPWFREWVTRRELSDPYWAPMQLGAALERVDVPVLLQAGWHDVFLDQTLAQYARLHSRGVDVSLTVGPWQHFELLFKAFGAVMSETLRWLAERTAGRPRADRAESVRIFVTGAQQWCRLPAWPPAAGTIVLWPHLDGSLGAAAASGGATATVRYDPAQPTPSIGGRRLPPAAAGRRDDRRLAQRDDVLSFTGPPLATALEVIGVPRLVLEQRGGTPFGDLFVRISEVAADGGSTNVSDGFLRLDPARASGRVELSLDAVAHRFAAGNRIRLLIAGGAFPRWERNLGVSGNPGLVTEMAPTERTIELAGSQLTLPVSP